MTNFQISPKKVPKLGQILIWVSRAGKSATKRRANVTSAAPLCCAAGATWSKTKTPGVLVRA